MSSGTVAPPPAEPKPEQPSYEAFIDERLRRTRRQVRGVDIVGGLILLLIGTLVYLLGAVVVDQWVISGGLGFWGRLFLLLVLLAGVGYYFARFILTPVVHRINPIFAAHTIEQSRPSLKNSLINFLLLRGHRGEVPQLVYRTIEHRAAADLSQVEIEVAVDRTRVIRLGYVLAGIVAVCGLYMVFSPKNPLSSAARVLWPWSQRPVPTWVTIEKVDPGNAVAFHGEFVPVSARVWSRVGGVKAVTLHYSTADGQTVDQRIPMTRPENGYRRQYRCRLPLEELGLQQDVEYYLTAGDCTTPRFTIDVQTAPTILVDRVEYDYPDYTGFSNRVVNRHGDVRAIEGTKITIHATANRTIHKEMGAKIDLNCNGLHEQNMRHNGKTATGHFTLRLDPKDPNLPQHDSYQLRFRDEARRLNPRPTRHRIEVIRDLPPEIQLLDPQEEEVRLALDGRLGISVRAQDPDFALRKVVLRAECSGRSLVIAPMLDKLHQGPFQGSYIFEPARAKFERDSSDPGPAELKPGDRVRYWAEAQDNKEPVPGRCTTAQQWITIVEPPRQQPPPEQSDGAGQEKQPRREDGQSQPAEDRSDEDPPPREDQTQDPPQKPQEDESQDQDPSEPGQHDDSSQASDGSEKSESPADGQDRKQTSDGQSDEPREPIDPETQDGDAIHEILEHREQQQEQGEKSGEKQPGEERSGGEKSGGEKSGGEKSGGEKSGGEKSGGEKSGGEKSGGEKSGGEKSGGEKSGGEKSGGEKSGEQESPGAGKPSEDETGPPSSQGQNRDREKKSGEAGQNPGQKQPAESPSTSPHNSDSQGETSGDRSGGGEEGGGQDAKQQGTGAAGSNTEADDGGSAGKQPGEGETGNRGGNQVETEGQTGSSETKRGGPGSEGGKQPGGAGQGEKPDRQDASAESERPQEDTRDGGQPGARPSSGLTARGEGNPMVGGGPRLQSDTDQPPKTGEPGGDDPNLDYARRAADLALEHLDDQMDQDNSELLDRLGWTREDAKSFLQKWAQMKRAAAGEGPERKTAQNELDRALKSLGLRPRGTQLRGGGTGDDRLREMREAGRFDPPSDWSELFRAYTRGVTSGGRK